MTSTLRAVIRDGRIEPLEPLELPEGAQIVVTLRSENEDDFWLGVSQASLGKIWDNSEDDVYAALLEE